MPDPESCTCMSPTAHYTQFRTWRSLPTDCTEGRNAGVDIRECITCGNLWLHYQVEYEAFSNSGRWARGLIDRKRAISISTEEAADFIDNLPEYIRGGSRFEEARVNSGKMYWGI